MSAGRKAGGQLALKKVRSVCEKAVCLKRSLSHPYCAAVIVAAGSASRMEGTDKIFTLLDRLPVICRTVEAFQKCSLIDEIVLVTRPEKLERLSRLCPAYPKVRMVVPGGETRLGSVLAGLRAVSEQTQLVAVQDGARPLVSEKVISAAVVQAGRCGAAAPAVPVKDTIKVASGGAVVETPDRSSLFAVQTPQVFDVDLLRGALQNALEKQLPVTDDCSAVEAIGKKVFLTEGSEENIKITTPLDLELAEAILRRRREA